MKLSVIIPVYNEKKTIRELVSNVRSLNLDKEIILIDDCSNDGSRRVLETLNYEDVKIIYNSSNRGKGYVIKNAFEKASGDAIIIQDADMEYDVKDYYKLMKPFEKEDVKIVYGSRFMGKCENMTIFQIIANNLFNFLTNFLHRSKLTDTCTCYKLFRTDLIKSIPLRSNGFEICHEINAKLLRRGYNIMELPINYRARTKKEGKKVGVKTFFTSLYAIFRFWLKD